METDAHSCPLCRPAVRMVLVLGAGLLADVCLPLTSHPTLSDDGGRHPKAVLAGLVIALVHFNSARWGLSRYDPLSAAARRLLTPRSTQ